MAVLARAGVVHQVHDFGHDRRVTAYGLEAAQALQVQPDRVFKTLVCAAGRQLAVAIVPVTTDLDLKALAVTLGVKSVDLAEPAVAQRATGYVVGGISPIGQKRRLLTVIDQTATGWDTIFVSGGRRGLEVELAPDDLLVVTAGRLAAIGKS
jgi:Cys-tRNA(Pro)/Cys-tRNA(Cys) deacylase